MEHRFFSREAQDLLSRPERWRLVSSWCPPDIAPAGNAAHRRWMTRHTHSHEHQEILLTLGDGGFQALGGSLYPCSAGTIFLFDSFEDHDLGYPPSMPGADHLWIVRVHDSFLARLISTRDRGTVPASRWSLPLSAEEPAVTAAASFLDRRALAGLPPAALRASILAAVASLTAVMLRLGCLAETEGKRASLQQQIISTIEGHLRRTGGRGAGLDQLARMAGYSKYHFLRLFKEHTGRTVHDYIDLCRLQKVGEMRREGCPEKQIADVLGFSCPATYTRWLRGSRPQDEA